MNVIARLEYELAYYDSAVHRFNHYTTRTPLGHWRVVIQWNSLLLEWQYILSPPPRGWVLWRRNITATTHVMQSSSNKLSFLVSDSAKYKQTKFDTYALIAELTLSGRLGLGVCQAWRKVRRVSFMAWSVSMCLATLKSYDTMKQFVCRWQ